MKIALTGSLGNISRPLSQQLIKHGHDVTIISSSAERVKEIERLGATAAIGKVDDINFLSTVFRGSDAVYCMIPPNFGHANQLTYYESQGNNYAAAIRQSEVKRVIHLSSYGAHLPSGTGLINGSYRCEQILNSIPKIQLTHIRPTYFYYNLLAFIHMIKAVGFIGAVYGGEDKLPMVSPADIAEAIAEEIETGNNFKAIRYVSSDERTCSEVAEVLGNAIGIPTLKWIALPKDQVLKALLERSMPENVALNLVELGEALHTGRLSEHFEQNKPALAKVKLEDYANEFSEIYHSK
ncbi:NmrA family NAD(P)-binding protein [Chryseosolibacter indicus]|uniref:NAD(P)H-binding protein n=1 Tax=Chryseosolibacter indicus TaxID=2782351 RepID=A0ABS5VK33_9BACT|nr:NAD(P)H-binding protein [Chryseosolibacter indicus]MBT1701792.1 NAD(P)H-binding protein [Chryseosolibacter indicus]